MNVLWIAFLTFIFAVLVVVAITLFILRSGGYQRKKKIVTAQTGVAPSSTIGVLRDVKRFLWRKWLFWGAVVLASAYALYRLNGVLSEKVPEYSKTVGKGVEFVGQDIWLTISLLVLLGFALRYFPKGRQGKKGTTLTASKSVSITHTGPPAFQGQYQYKWKVGWWESVFVSVGVILLAIAALIAVSYVGNPRGWAHDWLTWAMTPVYLSRGILVIIVCEILGTLFLREGDRLYAMLLWAAVTIFGWYTYSWGSWFSAPLSHPLWDVGLKTGIVLPKALFFFSLCFTCVWASWKHGEVHEKVLIPMLVILFIVLYQSSP